MISLEKFPRVLRRLPSDPEGFGQPQLFDIAEQPAPVVPDSIEDVSIEQRVGSRPSHLMCPCPLSWLIVCSPVIYRGENVGLYNKDELVFVIFPSAIIADSTNEAWQSDVKSIGGGIATYELLVATDGYNGKQSIDWALWQSGQRFVKDPFTPNTREPAIQEPLPGLESPPLPFPVQHANDDLSRRPEWIAIGGPKDSAY